MRPTLSTRSIIRRSADQSGFTLIELLVVVIIIGVLLAIAVPSYLGMRERAGNIAAKANLRAAMPAAETYYNDNLTYIGMGLPQLRAIDVGLSPTLTVVAVTPSTYCITDTIDGRVWSVRGPGASPITYRPNATCT